ncbi:MAG: hypothetical protein AB7L84_08770 [Acidimicrobiia bacterium]
MTDEMSRVVHSTIGDRGVSVATGRAADGLRDEVLVDIARRIRPS